MKYSRECTSCGRQIRLTFDETDATCLFCPFCGEELGDDGYEEFDDAPGIRGANDPDNWNDQDCER